MISSTVADPTMTADSFGLSYWANSFAPVMAILAYSKNRRGSAFGFRSLPLAPFPLGWTNAAMPAKTRVNSNPISFISFAGGAPISSLASPMVSTSAIVVGRFLAAAACIRVSSSSFAFVSRSIVALLLEPLGLPLGRPVGLLLGGVSFAMHLCLIGKCYGSESVRIPLQFSASS